METSFKTRSAGALRDTAYVLGEDSRARKIRGGTQSSHYATAG
jgi:hypothetical protein